MPAGGGAIGYAAFAAVKYAGYSGFAYRLNQRFAASGPRRSPWLIGAARTGIGLAFGVGFWAVTALLLSVKNEAVPLMYLGLIPVRIVEWWLLLWWFFQLKPADPGFKLYVFLGILLSFLLDAIAVAAAFAIPGGLWIC